MVSSAPIRFTWTSAVSVCSLGGSALTVTLDEGVSVEELRRAILALTPLSVAVEHLPAAGKVAVTLAGDARAVDVGALARRIAAGADDYIELTEAWRPGWLGMMQLLVIMMLVERLRGDVSWR